MRLPAPRERRRSTVLGEPFLRVVSTGARPETPETEPPQAAETSEPQSLDPFRAMVNLFNACQQADAEIAEIEETLAVDPDALPPEAVVAPAQKLLAQTQNDIERLPPGKASEHVIKTAQREGLAVSDRVLEADARARQRFTTGAISDAADRLAARVSEDPAALKPSLKMLNDLIETADFDPSDKRLIAANLEARLRDAAEPEDGQADDRLTTPERTRDAGKPETDNAAPLSGRPRADLSEPFGSQEDRAGGATVRDQARSNQVERADRNEILETQGFRFVEASDGGFWADRQGRHAAPTTLREVVSEDIERRAEERGWTSGRILTELHRAKSGLPVDERKNVETAFAFLPFVAPLLSAGAATGGAVATVGGAATAGGAAVSAGALLKAIMGGLGLAALLGLPGDTPLKEIREVDGPADDPTVSGVGETPTSDGDDDPDAGIPVPPVVSPASSDDDDDRETVIVYRVEGDENRRLLIDRFGMVTITDNRGRMLHVNFGQRRRALWFLRRKIRKGEPANPVLKSFEVPREFLDILRAASIEQEGAKKADPEEVFPRRVDTKTDDQFELPANWIEALRNAILQGTGVIVTPQELGID